MAIDVGDIVATLRAKTDGFASSFQKAFSDASRSAKDFGKSIDSEISGVGGSVDGVTGKFEKFKGVLSGAAVSAVGLGLTGAVTQPLIEMGVEAVKTADMFQRAELAFTTMLGTEAQAKQFIQTLKEIAVTTPFEFTQLQDASKRLLAMGIEAEKIPGMIRNIGDAVAGLGSGTAGFNRITLALGQINAKGRLTAEEMRQLTEAGIGAWSMLATHLNITVAEAMERVTKKQVDSATAITAITEGMAGKFGGLMEKQSKTIEGTLSNLRDSATLIMGEIGIELIKTLKLPEVLTTLGDFARRFLVWFQSLDSGTKQFILVFTGTFAASGPLLVALGAFMAALAAGFGPILAGGAIISAAIAGLTLLVTNWQAIKDKAVAIWLGLKNAVIAQVTAIAEGIKTHLTDKLMAIVAPVQKFADSVLGIFKRLRHEVVGGSEVPDMVKEIGDHMRMLDKNMTAPARVAAQGTWDVFRELSGNMGTASRQISTTMVSVWSSATNSLSNALATQLVKGNDWRNTMESLAITVLGTFINLGVQLIAQKALELAMRTSINGAIVAGEAATAGSVVSIWTGASAAVLGTFGAMSAGIATFFSATIVPMFVSVGTAVTTFLASLATALDISIFGAPFSIPVWAAVGLVAAAIGVISAFSIGAFAEGGIVKGPMMGLVGEAGPEAIIPLDQLGSIMGSGETTVIVELDGRTIARSVFDTMPSIMRVRGISA